MTQESGYGVLTDAQWEELAPLIERAGLTRPSGSICGAPSKRLSGGTETARSGAAFRRIWGCGGWRRRPYPLEPPWRVEAPAGAGATARRHPAGPALPRCHHDPGAPENRGCGEKGGSSAQRGGREALGRSRGGFSTNACMIAGGSGRVLGFPWAPEQARELPMAPTLLSFRSALALCIVADRGYASHAGSRAWTVSSLTVQAVTPPSMIMR